MKFQARLTTAIATGAVLLNAIVPMAFAQDVTVSTNGALSNNTVNVSNNHTTTVNQTNSAAISNNVNSNATTGGNTANFNTGGSSTVMSGNVTSNVTLSTAANLNKASVDNCACDNTSANVNISDNGALSTNAANVSNNSGQNATVFVSQNNEAAVSNNVNSSGKTGDNDASFNTGGFSGIQSGNVIANVKVTTATNANVANVGGASTGLGGGSSIDISHNGALSLNAVNLHNDSAVVVDQNNSAEVANNVNNEGKTGKNTANFNTGGTTIVKSGDVSSDTTVRNLLNFNSAAVDCGCTVDNTNVTLFKNGAESLNKVNVDSSNGVFAFGDNEVGLANNVNNSGKTGLNEATFGTGGANGDPLVVSGGVNSSSTVSNTANVNAFDQGGMSLPSEFNFQFDLSGLNVMSLLGFLHFGL